MVKQVVSLLLYRVLLPLALLTAVVFRFNVFSSIYLILLMLNPFLPAPSSTNMKNGHPKRYLVSVLSLSMIFSASHVVFQAVLISGTDYPNSFNYCDWKGRLFAFFGFHSMFGIRFLDALRLIGLDLLVLFSSFGVFVTCSKLQVPPPPSAEAQGETVVRTVRRRRKKTSELLHWIVEFCVLVLLAGAGILHPSILASVYFIVFMFACTWVACNQRLGRKYLLSKVPLAVFACLHFVSLYVYQLDYVQTYLPPENLISRILGLTNFVDRSCESARTLVFRPLHWAQYVSPLFILGVYWLLVHIIRYELMAPPVVEEEVRITDATVSRNDSKHSHVSCGSIRRRRTTKRRMSKARNDRTRLLDDDRTGRTYQSTGSSGASEAKDALSVDPNGSVVWTSESDFPNREGDGDEEDGTPAGGMVTKLRKVSSPLMTALKLIAKGSYVATLIIMMTWSITYHSWLTFVLLLWSCILWMCPNSRQACLRSSPALVAYAEALLVLQYILGLDADNTIIPKFNKDVEQIGFQKYGDLSYQPLAIKILYTLMFWITLRQFVEEKQETSRRDISEALRRHFSIVPSVTSPNPIIRIIAETVYNLLVKYWIWVVAIMLMVISLGGDRVVAYRIVYMFLFLFFILMFQFSYEYWRKVTYGFWLTVIIFSMLVLILIYTYQFEGFEKHWADYLHIPESIQQDLGLVKYTSNAGSLFVQLLTPTFFLIITIIQLHYFHHEFLVISDINYRSSDQNFLNVCSVSVLNETSQTQIDIEAEPNVMEGIDTSPIKLEEPPDTSLPHTPTTPQRDRTDSARTVREWEAFRICMKRAFLNFMTIFSYLSELFWRFLEIHIFKIIMFSVLCLATNDVSAIHIVYVFFVVMALPSKSLQTFFSHCCAMWTAMLLITKMIYQLNIADKLSWTVDCANQTGRSDLPFPLNGTVNNTEWIGYKATDYLVEYCKGYIGLILVLTIQAVVKIRQSACRLQLNEAEPKPGVLFPEATRATADSSVLDCLKFLANYVFYKFGLEICFVTTVGCIGNRLDVFAMLAAIWLCIMFLMRRKTISKIWPFYVTYQCIVLPIQYMMCVGLPPALCLGYPWMQIHENLQEWLYLPDFVDPPDSKKIMVDFFQLLFACCQLFVFRIETGPIAEMYEGGSNKEIFYDNDNSSQTGNPIPDFVTYTKSSLDMLKAVIFVFMFWITLAVVFEAGTSRVNLFAMGYVIGCFYFLWTGNEFYLKPRKLLLKIWNILIAYNVIIILIKSVLQLIGCVYIDELKRKELCPVVQLFGIACLKNSVIPDLKSECPSDNKDAGIIIDGVCFGFLLFQKRLFSSYYFQHLVNEIKAQQVLSSRGAELIHEIQMKDVQEQQDKDKDVMEKIKKKMDRIRAYQKKIRGDMEPETHYAAIRSGDYYMFDDFSDEDIDLELSSRHKRTDDEDEEESAEVKEKGLNAFLSKAMRTSMKSLNAPRKESGEVDDFGDSSQQSAIVSADREAGLGTLSERTSHRKSPDPLTISSSGPAISLSLPTPVPSSSSSRPEEATLTPQDGKPEGEPEEKQPETFVEKMKRGWDFFCKFVNGILISTTAKLNAVSRDYRYVARKLSVEKQILKEKFTRNGSFQMDEAEQEMLKNRDFDTLPSPSKEKVSPDGGNVPFEFDSCELKAVKSDQPFPKSLPIIMKFLTACYYAAISRSELFCYIIIIINQMKTASILSLPLPLFVFLWGTLSVPRPSKAFWITIITYTEAIVVLKYLFKFYFFNWNKVNPPLNDPFYLPVLFGVRRADNNAIYDLLVLLVVFFHRVMLKSLGLWQDTEREFNIPSAETTASSSLKGSEKDEPALMASTIPAITKDAASDDHLTEVQEECSDEEEEKDDEDGASDSTTDQSPVQMDVKKCANKVFDPIKKFFHHLLYPKYRVTIDVYAFMFFCDFINFFIVVFGYWAFGTGGTEAVASYFEENKVPIPFLIMLVAQFALIVTDRALYLRKYILGKLIFQIILVFVVHMWMFFVLPSMTLRSFKENFPPKMWYFIKSVYLLLSAYQIRSGYPTRILGNFFCKKYNYANLFLFRGYMLIPFLYELRSLMDWIWTDTSMNTSNWLKMEDIYANIFILKCTRRAENDYPTPRGAKRTMIIKYGVGGSLLLLIILIIWFPLLLFALGNTVGRPNLPTSCTVELGISGFEPLFRMTALKYQIKPLTADQWSRLHKKVVDLNDPPVTSFLTGYTKDDTVIVELSRNSTATWEISPPSRSSLVEELRGESDLTMVLSWSFSKGPSTPGAETTVKDSRELNLTDQRQLRDDLASMIDSNLNESDPKAPNATLNNIFPNFVKVSAKGCAVSTQLYMNCEEKVKGIQTCQKSPFGDNSPFRNLNIGMWLFEPNDTWSTKWWEISDYNCPPRPPYDLPGIDNCDYLRLIAFNDKVFPTELSLISGYGILGLYTTFVFLVSRLVRGFFAGSSFLIMFDDMPNVDRVLQLCLDIYLVRQSGEFTLEEDLFAKLIFLYRSPEMLIKWTRPPDSEVEGQEGLLALH